MEIPNGYYAQRTKSFCKLKPSSEGVELTKWLKDDAKAQELLVTRMEEDPLTHVKPAKTWIKLKTVYDEDSVVSMHLLQQRSFAMELISSISTCMSTLSTAGETLS